MKYSKQLPDAKILHILYYSQTEFYSSGKLCRTAISLLQLQGKQQHWPLLESGQPAMCQMCGLVYLL